MREKLPGLFAESSYKYHREIEYVHMLSGTISGKIKRGELKKMELQRKHQ